VTTAGDEPSDWRDILPEQAEGVYDAVGALRRALLGVRTASDEMFEAAAREWVIETLREEAASTMTIDDVPGIDEAPG
jgi:hypothetical protein